MKFVVYSLLLANLAMAAWLYSHQDTYRASPDVVDTIPSAAQTLQLLSERTPLADAPNPVSVPEITAAPTTVAEAVIDSSSPSPAEIGVAESAQKPPLPTTENPTQSVHLCHVIGPFNDRASVADFAAALTALGVTTAVRTTQTDEPSGYWVYLPSMPYADAQRIVADFKAKGVKDYFLGRQFFISLGVFTDKKSAEARSQAIAALGYTPILEPRYQRRVSYWLDADETGSTPVSAAQWRTFMASQPAIQRQTVTCE